MSGVNPQGCQVYSFKLPSHEELDHDFLWRCLKRLPERGRIGIFNRSYYKEVLVVRVHPELLEPQRLPKRLVTKRIWRQRFEDINAVESYLAAPPLPQPSGAAGEELEVLSLADVRERGTGRSTRRPTRT